MDNVTLVPLILRWWRPLIIAAVVAGSAASVVADLVDPTYQADIELLVGPVNTDLTTLRAAGELSRTYSELASSRPFLATAGRAAGAPETVDELEKAVKAGSNQVSRVVTISVRNTDPKVAAAIASSLGEQLRSLSGTVPPETTETIKQLMTTREIGRLPVETKDRVERAAARVLGQSLAGRVQVVDPAEVPTDPVSPIKSLIVILASLAGVLVVLVLLLVRESNRRSRAGGEDLAALGGTAFLGSVDTPRSRKAGSPLLVESAPGGASAHGYRLLAAKMGYLDERPPVRTLVILDCDDGRSAATVAANLAAVMAEADLRVLLIDADTSGDGVTRLMGLTHLPGYGDIPVRQPSDRETLAALRHQHDEGVAVVPAGRPSAAAMLDVERVKATLAKLRASDAEIVVVAAPPLHRSPTAILWAGVADGTLFVVQERTTPEDVEETVRSMEHVDANMVGTVLARDRLLGSREAAPLEHVLASARSGDG